MEIHTTSYVMGRHTKLANETPHALSTATSDGTITSLSSVSGGHCASHNMRIAFYVCLNDAGMCGLTTLPTTVA